MRRGPKKKIFRRRRRLGVFLYLPLTLLVLGGLLVLGFDFIGSAASRHVTEVKSPVLAKAPQTMSGKARDAAKAKEKAAEQKKIEEQKAAEQKRIEEKRKADAEKAAAKKSRCGKSRREEGGG